MSEALYDEAIKALAQRSRAQGRLDAPDATATVDNPLCGDRITVDVALDGDRIGAIGHEVKGCLLCEAACGLLDERAPGASRDAVEAWPGAVKAYLKDADAAEPVDGLEPFAPARAFRSRHRCVALAFEALAKALG